MEKTTNQKCHETVIKESKKLEKQEKKEVDIPRLTCDYLDQTLQIA